MKKRIDGLRRECRALAEEIERLESGGAMLLDLGPVGGNANVAPIWLAHLRQVLAAKQSLLSELEALSKSETKGKAGRADD